jgi:hypothetical protein
MEEGRVGMIRSTHGAWAFELVNRVTVTKISSGWLLDEYCLKRRKPRDAKT